jgi:hypothetical protein
VVKDWCIELFDKPDRLKVISGQLYPDCPVCGKPVIISRAGVVGKAPVGARPARRSVLQFLKRWGTLENLRKDTQFSEYWNYWSQEEIDAVLRTHNDPSKESLDP